MFTDKTKRKNDTPRSRRPLIIMAGLLVLLFGMVIAAQFMFMPTDPTGKLYYNYSIDPTSPVFSVYDFESDTEQSAPFPLFSLDDYNLSHDGLWRAAWEDNGGEQPDTLRLLDMTTYELLDKLGGFYAPDHSATVSWSPDNQWIVFSAYSQPTRADEDRELWLVNAFTGETRRLTDNDYSDDKPLFSPDGRSIAYISMPDGGQRLSIMAVDTQIPRLLTDDNNVHDIAWSPNGQWLAFTADINGDAQYNGENVSVFVQYDPISLWLIRADGSDAQLFTSTLEAIWGLYWFEHIAPTPDPRRG